MNKKFLKYSLFLSWRIIEVIRIKMKYIYLNIYKQKYFHADYASIKN